MNIDQSFQNRLLGYIQHMLAALQDSIESETFGSSHIAQARLPSPSAYRLPRSSIYLLLLHFACPRGHDPSIMLVTTATSSSHSSISSALTTMLAEASRSTPLAFSNMLGGLLRAHKNTTTMRYNKGLTAGKEGTCTLMLNLWHHIINVQVMINVV